MKVKAAAVVPYEVSLRQRYEPSSGALRSRSGFLLRIESDAGVVGWGDAAPLAGYTSESPQDVSAALTELADGSSGQAVADLTEAGEALVGATPCATAAVASAAADLTSRVSGDSLATHLAVQAPLQGVRAHALVAAVTPADVAAAGHEVIRAGFVGCKLKVGARSVEDDVERITRLREAVGSQCLLRLDANGGWSVNDALRVLEATLPLGIDYVEDPVADWEAMAAVKDRIDVRLAADQMLRRIEDVAVAADVVSVAVIKPSAVGGPSRALTMADTAVDAGLAVVFGSLLESAVGLTAAIHTAAAWGRADTVSGVATGSLLAEDVGEPPPVLNGAVVVPTGPGLGVPIWGSPTSEVGATEFPEGGAW